MTFEEDIEMIRNGCIDIRDIPISDITEELCLKAVKQFGHNLFNVPNQFRTKEICMEAIRRNSDSIIYIDNPTQEMIDEAIKDKSQLHFICINGEDWAYHPDGTKDNLGKCEFIKEPEKLDKWF